MKIGIVALGNSKNDFFKNAKAGYTKHISTLSRFLQERGIDVSLICINDFLECKKKNERELSCEKASSNSGDNLVAARFLVNYWLRQHFFEYFHKSAYEGMMRAISACDIIDFQNIRLATPFSNKIKKRIKYLITQHYDVPKYYRKLGYSDALSYRVLSALQKKVLQRANGVVCLLKEDRDEYESYGIENVIHTPVPVDVPKKISFCLNNEAVFVGSNMPANQNAVVSLIQEIAPSNPQIIFNIAGAISNFCRGMTLTGNIRVHGIVSIPELESLYSRASFVVIPMTVGEGYSTKAMEAFAYGRVVLSSKNGVRGTEAIPGQHYVLCETTLDYKGNLMRLLSDNKQTATLSTNARRLAISYSPENVFDKYFHLVKNLA